ncbi:hypothetical protein [uncultured Bartonella sp.]|uniref:hypothetical protein n=1 Tax=uncultured Bartonella sp. TaxID=104108 RepID=UPI002601C8CE|nr:hypothetical protein [uncultured Bartonella sp.]
MRDEYQSGYENADFQDPYIQQPMQHDAQLDPVVENIRRRLMRLMIISVVITIVLILIILAAIIYKVTSSPSDKTPVDTERQMQTSPVPNSGANANDSSTNQTLKPASSVPEFIRRSIALPQGTRILSQSLSNDMIALETLTPQGNTELVIYDYRRGHLVAAITVDTSPVAKQPIEETTTTPLRQ